MRRRPWPVLILAFLHFLGPFFMSMIAALLLNMNYVAYLKQWFPQASFWGLFYLFVPYPLAGYAIYKMKPWSYPVFLSVVALNLSVDLHTWWHNPSFLPLPALLIFTTINILLVSYFLLPKVRRPYFNRSLRWWEAKPRYCIELPASLRNGSISYICTLGDLSETGAFFLYSKKLDFKRPVTLSFDLHGAQATFKGQLIYRRTRPRKGYGMKFIVSDDTRRQIHTIIHSLEIAGTPLKSLPDTLWISFLSWLHGFFQLRHRTHLSKL